MDANLREWGGKAHERAVVGKGIGLSDCRMCHGGTERDRARIAREKTYERGLVVGLKKAGLATDSQRVFPVFYLGEKIDEYIPDLLVEGRVIVDAKAVDQINDMHRSQMINYLRITKIPVGLIMNFSKPDLEWERIVLEATKPTPPDLHG